MVKRHERALRGKYGRIVKSRLGETFLKAQRRYSTFLQYALFTLSQKVSSLTRLFANLSQNSRFYETFHGDLCGPYVRSSYIIHQVGILYVTDHTTTSYDDYRTARKQQNSHYTIISPLAVAQVCQTNLLTLIMNIGVILLFLKT